MAETHDNPVTVALPTLGCKANRCDSDALAAALAARGYRVVPEDAPADIYIVNTCTVTREAEAKSRKTLRRALRLRDGATMVVTGCYASLEPQHLLGIEGVDAVVPIAEQARIPDLVMQLRPPATPMETPRGLTASVERTRATLKVQDGCNLRCAFCAVTLARGPVRSRPIAEVVGDLRALVACGYREIVLTGIRLDAYGIDLGIGLADLLDATRGLGIPRLRFSSLEPLGIDARLADAMAAHPGLCPHFHICLQSGDDGILRAMRRGYTTDGYRRATALLRERMPDASFSTDLIVGFPGENEAAFANTCAFVEEIGFFKLHVFPFSPRPRTEAATLPGHIPDAVKAARKQALFDIEKRLFRAFAAQWVGRTVSVLVERSGARGYGLTPHYLRVRAPFPKEHEGEIVQTRVLGVGDGYVAGVE